MARETNRAQTDGNFVGFGPRWAEFFRGLAEHQTKEWFEANRSLYDEDVLEPLRKLVASLTFAFEVAELPLRGDAKASLFRLNRDIRFSKDKRPYKTNVGAVLTRDGTKSAPGLLYLHIEPAGSFAALGFYIPGAPQLAAIREAIVADPARWRALEATLARQKLVLSRESALTRLPKGFDADAVAEVADAVRLKSFVVSRKLPQSSLRGPSLVDDIVAFAQAGLPLLSFGWSALAKAPRLS